MRVINYIWFLGIVSLLAACGGGGGGSSVASSSSSMKAASSASVAPDTNIGSSSSLTSTSSSSAVASSSKSAEPVVLDKDGDGIPDTQDAFPNDRLEWVDTDKDGVGDNGDKTPLGDPMPAWGTFQGNALHTGVVPLQLDINNFSTRWNKELAIDFAAQGAAADGYIFMNLNRVLYALSSATGNLLWTTNVTSSNPPAYADGVVYVETGGHEAAALWAFNAADGSVLFKSPIDDQFSSFYAPTIVDGVAYIAGGSFGGVYAIDAKTGAQKWWLGLNQYDQFTPAVTADYVLAYTGSYSPQLSVINRKTGVLAFSIADPHFEWNGWSMNLAPVVLGDSVVAIHNGRLLHFNLATKTMDWDIKSAFSGQPSLKENRIYAIDNGSVEVRDIATGTLLDTIYGIQPFTGNLLVTNNLLFVRDAVSTYAFDIATKRLVWTLNAKSGAFFMADGALYVMAEKELSAINIEGDIDQDKLPDWWEKSFGKNIDPASDLDKDGLTAAKEFANSTDPFKPDTDGDGLLDGAEVNTHLTSPLSKDTDNDGLSDSSEVNTYRTSPTKSDTDGDNLSDELEVAAGLDPLDSTDADKDSDGDGFTNSHEVLAGSNPKNAVSVPTVSDWSMLNGNAKHNGYQPLVLDAKTFAVRWTTQVKGNATSVATGKGRIFLNDGINTLSLNAGTGEFLWSYPFAGGSASYADGKVYGHIGGHEATAFIGLDAANGSLQFSATHGDQWSTYSAPTIYKGHAYVNGGYYGGMVAFDAVSGVKEWQISSPTVTWSNIWEPAVSELGMFVLAENKLRSLSLSDGSIVFDINSPVAADGTTPIIGSRGNVITLGGRLVSYDIANRKVAWQSEISAGSSLTFSSAAVGNSQIYAMAGTDLVVFDELNGKVLWRKTVLNSPTPSNIVATASHIFVADVLQTYAVDLRSHDLVWTHPKGGRYLSIGNEGALFIANDNDVTAIEIEGDKDEDGLPDWWERNYGRNLTAGDDIDSDGLTNLEEFKLHTNPLSADTDGDGLSDFAEVRTYKTNPLLSDSDKDGLADNLEVTLYLTNPLQADSDDDGLDDATEQQYGLNPNEASDATQDLDGDGFFNANEIAAGTDINNALVLPVAHEWAMLQGNASHDGFQPVALTPSNFALRWSKDFGYNINCVATGGGSVFVTSKAWFGSTLLSALNPTDATVEWSHDFGSISSMSSPSYAGDTVYVHSGGHEDAAFWAFNASTGVQKFRSPHSAQWATYSSPTLYADKAYMNGGYFGGMVAFDTVTGGKLWEGTATWADNLEPAVNENSVFIPANNQVIIRNRLTGVDQRVVETPLNTTTLVLGKRDNIIAVGSTVKSIGISTGAINWTSVQNDILGLPAVGNQSVYFISSGTLYVVNEQSGRLRWSWTPPGAKLTGNIIATLSHLFVATGSTTYAIDIKTGLQSWSYNRGGSLSLGDDGNLYIAGQTELTAISVINN